jgi:ATP-dependent Lon protease
MDNFEQPIAVESAVNNNHLNSYCMVVLHGLVVFPHISTHFDIAHEKAILAVGKALKTNKQIFLVTQKNTKATIVAPKDLYKIGVVATIKQVIKLPNDIMRVIIVASQRKEIDSYVTINPFFEVVLKDVSNIVVTDNEIEASRRELMVAWEEYKKQDNKVSQEVLSSVTTDDAAKFGYAVANIIYKTDADKMAFLSESNIAKQLQDCAARVYTEIDLMQLEKQVQTKVRKRIDKQQREYYLREQQKVIQDELGDNENEIQELRSKIDKFGLNDDDKSKLLKELSRLEKTQLNSPEYGMLRSYFDTLVELPWQKSHTQQVSLEQATSILDSVHYGLDKVKKRILEFLAVAKLTNNAKSPILCFVGPPGVGKTSIVDSIANAMGRKLVTMSLGGVRDEAEIKGHRRTYIGAIPGRIINGLRQVDVNNPVFLLDEIDKMASTNRGDPAASLLEILDYNTNNAFKDHYIEVPFDLSRVVFIATANNLESIPLPLLDRLEIVELGGYTFEEKFEIARRYLVPKQIKFNGLEPQDITIPDTAIADIIDNYTRESGVRRLEREIGSICRKVAVAVAESIEQGQERPSTDVIDLVPYLGASKYDLPKLRDKHQVGVVNGLAWTQVGGKLLHVEAIMVPGKGEIKITGNLGNVMKESCTTAMTVVRSRATKYGIDASVFRDNDFHVHFPEGATPKDGPSAGIAISLAILSVATNRPIDSSIAMTGEVSLQGNVLAIGGLKEKTLAALRNGIKTLILAESNHKDIEEIPQSVQDKIEIQWVDVVDQVFDRALI